MGGGVLVNIDLVILDGDGTLWRCLDDTPKVTIALSDKGDGPGRSDYRFEPED